MVSHMQYGSVMKDVKLFSGIILDCRHIEKVSVRIAGRRPGWGSNTAHSKYKWEALPLPANFLGENSLQNIT